MAMTDMGIVRRSLTSRWFASVTTVLVVGVAVGLLLVLASLRNAGEKAFARGTGNMHVLLSNDVSPMNAVLNAVFYLGMPSGAHPLSKFDSLKDDRRVEWAVPVVQGDNYRGFPTLATTAEFFTKFRPAPDAEWAFAEGAGFDKPFDVVLGSSAAEGTGAKLGHTLNIVHGSTDDVNQVHKEFDFKVVGILKPTGTTHDRAVFITCEATWCVHAVKWRQERKDPVFPTPENLLPREKLVTGMFVRLRSRDGGDAPPTLPGFVSEKTADPTLTVSQPASEVRKLFSIVSGIDRIIVAIGCAVLVSSAVTVMLVLYQAMEMRRRQVAVLRVLGATRGRVFMLALTEAAVIGVLACLLGVVLAYIGSAVVAWGVHATFGLTVTPELDPRVVFVVCAGSCALACLAGVVPAAAAYRTDVLKSLRPVG